MTDPVRQASFGTGEIARHLRSRTDAQKFGSAVARAYNLLITPEGGLTNRPGFQNVREIKDSTKIHNRLIPFLFSNGQNYMLEFGAGWIRFHQIAGTVLSAGLPYEVATAYTESDLPFIKTTQSGDTMDIAVLGKTDKQLKRIAHTNWTLTDYTPASTVTAPAGLAFSVAPVLADSTHVGKAWDIVVTAYTEGDTPDESLPSNVLSIAADKALYPDRPAVYTWGAVSGAAGYNVYRGQPGAQKGYIGRTSTNSFRDDGQIPLYAEPPPSGRNPFSGGDPNRNAQVVQYHSQRKWFANTFYAPSTLFSTRLGNFKSMDAAQPAKVDDAITLTLATRRFEEVRAMVDLGSLWLFTSGAEWELTGVLDQPPNPQGVDAKRLSYWGSSWLDPVIVGDTILYVTDEDYHVRELGKPGADLTFLASHLFKEFTLVDIAFARTPFNTVWAVRNDGTLLALSYNKQQEQVGWTWHQTTGTVEAVATMPEGLEDSVYLIVKRTVNGVAKRYVERMATRQVDNTRWGVFLDASVFYDGDNTTATTMKYTGTYGIGGVGVILASAASFGVGDVGDEIVLRPAVTGGDIRLQITGFTDTTHVNATVVGTVVVPGDLQNVATTSWGWGRKTFGSLTHLEAVQVYALANGVLKGPYTIAGATLVLDRPYVHVVIGRTYNWEFEPLGLPQRPGPKNVHKVFIEVAESNLTGIQVAKSWKNTLLPWKSPAYQLADPVSGLIDVDDGTIEVQIASGWDLHGRFVMRGTQPFPFTICAITREVTSAQQPQPAG